MAFELLAGEARGWGLKHDRDAMVVSYEDDIGSILSFLLRKVLSLPARTARLEIYPET